MPKVAVDVNKDKPKTPVQPKTQSVTVGGRTINPTNAPQTQKSVSTPSNTSNVSVGGRTLSNTQKNDNTVSKAIGNVANKVVNNANKINTATQNYQQGTKSFTETQSKNSRQAGLDNQNYQIQQHQDRLDRQAERTRQEVKNIQSQKEEARNQRIAEDPTYAYNLYEFSNGNNVMGGKEYVDRVNNNNQQFSNLYASFEMLENQYKKDGNYERYANGFEELSRKYDDLLAEYNDLNTYKAGYNNSTPQQYEANRARMSELMRMTADLKKNGGSKNEIELLTNEYMSLKAENEQLQNLYDDISSLKDNDYYEWLKENGEESDIREFESLLVSQEDNGLSGFLKNRAKALGSNSLMLPYAVSSLADISRDLFGEVAGNLMDSVATNLQEKGFIDEQDFEKVMAVSERLREFEYDNDNNLSQMLRDYRERINREIHSGNKSDFELIAGDMIDSAMENYLRWQTLGTAGTFAMALTSFGDSFKEYKDKGYSNSVSALASAGKAYVTWWSENLSTERYFKLLGSTAGASIDKMFFSLLAENMISMVPEEGLEEGAEYLFDYAIDETANFLQPGIDNPEFKMGDLLKGSLIAMGSTAISGSMGATTGTMFYQNNVPVITNGKDYAQFKQETEYLKTIYNEEADIDVKAGLRSYINDCERRISEYEAKSPTAGSVILSSDNAELPTQNEADSTYKQSMIPEAVADSNEQAKTDNEIMEASEFVRAITQSYLQQNGIGMSVEEYVNTDEKTRQGFKNSSNMLSKSGAKYGFARMFNGQNGLQVADRILVNTDQSRTISFNALADLDDESYNKAMKFKDGIATDTNTIFKEAGSDPAIESSASHELTHFTEKSGLYEKLKSMVIEMAGKDRFDRVAKRLNDLYTGRKIKGADAEREAVAFFIQENIRNKAFAKRLAMVNGSAFSRLYSNLTSALSGDSKTKLENLMANAVRDAKAEMKREERKLLREKRSGYVGENYLTPNFAQMSVAEYNLTGRAILEDYLDHSGISVESKKELLDRMEKVCEVMTTFMETKKFPEFSEWQGTTYSIDREGNFSVVVSNGDYDLNIDFSTVCKKRKMMDKVLNELSKQGFLNTALGKEQLTQLRQIIQDHGMEVACGLCFVDAKRFNQGKWAGKFETKWNNLIDQLVALSGLDENEANTFGSKASGFEATPGLMNIDFNDPKYAEFVAISKNPTAYNLTVEDGRMAKALINNPDLRAYISTNSMYGSEGFEQLKANKPALYDLINASGGSSKPKLAHTEVLYNNEIVTSKNFNPEDARRVGGVRVQSFSDFMTNMVFDYVQMFGEMEAKGLTGHSYTKVKEYALFFGKSGMKINLSIIPAGFDPNVYTAEQIKEIRKDKSQKKLWDKLRENAGLDENGNYIFDKESFDWDLALEIQNLDGYDKNVGTVCVGVSDKHIFKMLDDDNVCMIIPYHRSGINPAVADMMGISVFNDYTNKQNTRMKNDKGRWVKIGKGFDFDFYNGSTTLDGTHFKGMIENGYDAKATADEYLSWCEKNGYKPKFDTFADHPNYYKLLIDFRAYDKNGNVAKQEPVKISGDGMNMGNVYIDPAVNPKLAEIYGNDIGFNNVLQKSLEVYESTEAYQNEKVSPIAEETVDKLGLKKQYSLGEENPTLKKINSDWEKAVGSNNMEEAQRLVTEYAKEYARATGRQAFEGYHGTNAKFNEFLKDKLGSKNFLAQSAYMGFFMAGSKETAESYTGLNTADMFRINFDPEMNKRRQQIVEKYGIDKLEKENNDAKKKYIEDALDALLADENGRYGKAIKRLNETDWSEDEKNEFREVIRDTARYEEMEDGQSRLNHLYDEYENTSDLQKQLDELGKKAGEEYDQVALDYLGYTPNIKHLFAFMKNPLVHDFKNEGRDVDFSELLKQAKEAGNDGAVFKNVQDGGDFDTIYVVFEPNQFKSADPVTYDNKGKAIPLEKRFNEKTSDLRYSLGEENSYKQKYQTGNKDLDEMMNNLMEDIVGSMSEEEFKRYMETGEFEYATNREVEDDPKVQDEGLWVKEPEGDYIKIDDGYTSNGKTVAWKDDRIQKLVKSLKDRTFDLPDNAYRHVYALNLSPHDYIALSYIFEPKHNKVWQNDIDQDPDYYNNRVFDPDKTFYKPTDSIGYMYFKVNTDGTRAKIVGQEGNHRSIILDESGYSKMPILLFANGNLNGSVILEGMNANGRTENEILNPNKKLITTNDYMAVAENNLDRLIKRYGSGANADVQYQLGEETNDAQESVSSEQDPRYFEYGMNPARNVDIQKKSNDGRPTRRNANNLANSSWVSDETAEQIAEDVANGEYAYIPVKFKEVDEQAMKKLKQQGLQKSYEQVMNAKTPTLEDISLSRYVMNQMRIDGKENTEEYKKLLQKKATMFTPSAQIEAYARYLRQSDPQEQLITIETEIQRMQDELTARWGDRAENLEIPEDLRREYLETDSEERRQQIREEIAQLVADKIPPTVLEQLNAWRHLSMLFNPKTWIKNRLSNKIFGWVDEGTRTIRQMLEKVAKDYGDKHENSIFHDMELQAGGYNRLSEIDRERKKRFEQDYNDNFKENISKYSNMDIGAFLASSDFGEMVQNKRRDFSWEFLNKLAEINRGEGHSKNKVLDAVLKQMGLSDAPAMRDAYSKAMVGYFKVNKLNPDTVSEDEMKKARDFAFNEALYATFNTNNWLASQITKFERNADKSGHGAVARLVVESFIPFKRTPLNIIRTGYNYTTVGLVTNLARDLNLVKKGTMTANQLINHMAQGLTGTALILLGSLLSHLGLFRTKDEDKDRKQYFDQDLGEQDYALVFDGATYTIDWLDPMIIPIAMGAEIDKAVQNGLGWDNAMNIISGLADPIFETSMFSGISKNLQSYQKGAKEWWGQIAQNILANYASQYIPSIVGATARTVDDTRRSTYTDKGTLDKFKRQTFNKIPGLSTLNEPYINREGEVQKNEDLGIGFAGRALLNFISPGYYSSKKIDKYDEEAYRLFENTGKYDAFPSNASKDTTFDKETMKFSPKEYTAWQQTRWGTEARYVNEFMDSQAYKNLSDDERLETIDKIRGYAQKVAKKDFLESREYKIVYDKDEYEKLKAKGEKVYYDKELSSVTGAIENDIDVYQYYDYHNNAGSKQAEKMEYLESSGFSKKQKDYLWSLEGYKGSYEDVYKKVFGKSDSSSSKKKKSSKSSKTSSKSGKVRGGSAGGITKARGGGRMNKLKAVTPKPTEIKKPSNFFKAYQDTLNKRSKTSSAGRSTVVCPRCGNRVSSGSSTCPVCGQRLS